MKKSFLDIQTLHDGYRSKRYKPSEIVQHYFKEISKSTHNAFLAVCEERAMEQARNADKQLESNPLGDFSNNTLFGVPIGIKDLIHVEGVCTTAGSKILENYSPPFSSTAVTHLEKSGAILLGKLNLDEFGMGSSNENSAFGSVSHPTHAGYVPGGSSGGSATAVSAGLCLAALGTDTGGSIRLPASFCGVVGIKPTYGRVSRYGMVAYASSLDQIGPMAQTVEDAARLLDSIAVHDWRDSTSAEIAPGHYLKNLHTEVNWNGLRIGVPEEYFGPGLSTEVEASIKNAIDWFRKKGATIQDISLPHSKYALSTYYLIAASEASSNLSRYDGVHYGVRPKGAIDAPDAESFYKSVRGLFGPEVKRRILLGTFALETGFYDAYYKKACQVRRLIKNDFEQAFQKVDVILGPVAPTTAFRMGEKISDPLQAYLTDILTIPTSLAGLPGMSVPCGADSKGLPIGLQMIGPYFSEATLLRLGHHFETANTKSEGFHAS